MSNPQTISFSEFLRIFKDNKASKAESRFCFILGAGASVASGIDSGATLSKDWLQAIKEDLTPEDYDKWVGEFNINTESPELHYPTIYQKRFAHNP